MTIQRFKKRCRRPIEHEATLYTLMKDNITVNKIGRI